MKKLINVIALALAANFLVAAGGVGWLVRTGHLDKARAAEVKRVLFPGPATRPTAGVTLAAAAAATTTRPAADPDADDAGPHIDALLAKATGRPAGEQVAVVRQAFDAQSAELDRRRRELLDLRHQVEVGRAAVADDRARLAADRKTYDDGVAAAGRLAEDKGFQETLAVYQAMSSKQVKTLFMSQPEDRVGQYLQAMPPKTAARIMKEFKTADETDRLQRVLERMRAAAAVAADRVAPPPAASERQ